MSDERNLSIRISVDDPDGQLTEADLERIADRIMPAWHREKNKQLRRELLELRGETDQLAAGAREEHGQAMREFVLDQLRKDAREIAQELIVHLDEDEGSLVTRKLAQLAGVYGRLRSLTDT